MNIGFRQYKLPYNIALNWDIQNQGFIILNQIKYGLDKAVDENKDTYCKLIPEDNANFLLLSFNEEFICDSIKIIFNTNMKQVTVLDNESNELFSQYNENGFTIVEKKINKKISSVILTNMQSFLENNEIQINSIEIYNSDTIIPPEGYYIKEMEIQSESNAEEGDLIE